MNPVHGRDSAFFARAATSQGVQIERILEWRLLKPFSWRYGFPKMYQVIRYKGQL